VARPRKTGLDYFRHDTHVRTSIEMEALIAKHGELAYGSYWICLERIAEESPYELELSDVNATILARRSGFELDKLMEVLDYCATRLHLFDPVALKQRHTLVSRVINETAEYVEGKRKKNRREDEETGGAVIAAGSRQTKQDQTKEKESKVNKQTDKGDKQSLSAPSSDDDDPAEHQFAGMLGMDDLVNCSEYQILSFCRGVRQHIKAWNRNRVHGKPFNWSHEPSQLDKDLWALLNYKTTDQRSAILVEAFNVLNERRNWPLYIFFCIRYVLEMSRKNALRNPMGYVLDTVPFPARLSSARVDGCLARTKVGREDQDDALNDTSGQRERTERLLGDVSNRFGI
jgi:hypothetical protein